MSDAMEAAAMEARAAKKLPPRAPLSSPGSELPFVPPTSGVAVRMYKQGLGDCFLLAFPTADREKPYYVLIDCGVLQGAPNADKNLAAVAKSIAAATGGVIHLLVVTHRHADHISGFTKALDAFKGCAIHNLWLPWAENPDDEDARRLWTASGRALTALTRAVKARPEAMAQLRSLLEFTGELGAADADPFEVLDPVRGLIADGAAPSYLAGGDGPLELPSVEGCPVAEGARIFVLGPPRDLAALGQMNPEKGSNETYMDGRAPNALTAFIAAAADDAGSSEDYSALRELSFPFDGDLRIPMEEAETLGFFKEFYGSDDARAWRRIDDDWLSSGEELALQLDNCVNNTSLALAIELEPSRKVLLFVGDAQVGNWLSWHDLKPWTLAEDGREVSARDLLSRTALYKVGHHGSHNATAAGLADRKTPWGLELMDSPDLVAMLPVDEEFANVVKRWPMPWPNMVTNHLEPKTGHRVMRPDRDLPAKSPGALSQSSWASFTRQVAATPLYVQYSLDESPGR
jgi:hypothetical protein